MDTVVVTDSVSRHGARADADAVRRSRCAVLAPEVGRRCSSGRLTQVEGLALPAGVVFVLAFNQIVCASTDKGRAGS